MVPPRRASFTEYARLRMHQRDILEEEVKIILRRPLSTHRQRRDGRREVRGKLAKGQLLVVYKQRKRDLLVINAMWE